MALGRRASFIGPAKPTDYSPDYSDVEFGPVARPADYRSIKRQFGPAKPTDYNPAAYDPTYVPEAPELTDTGRASIYRRMALGPRASYNEPAYVAARLSAQQRAVAAFGTDRGRVRVFNAASSLPVFVRVVRVTEDYVCRDPTCHRAFDRMDSATYRIPAGATGNIEYRPLSWREKLTPGLVQRVYWSIRPFPPSGIFLAGPNEQLSTGTTLFTVGAGAP
jgi:hypothetical protein